MRAQQLSSAVADQGEHGLAMDSGASPRNHGFYARSGKRAVDLVVAACGLIALTPVFAIVACCIKVTSRGPILYRQTRMGRDGHPFTILKFRSMAARISRQDPAITVAGDPRVTAIGRLLRHYKVDELPQLWNVLRGDMSLVGPRPEVPIYLAQYTDEQRGVLSARPGITDPASLAYRHEEELLAMHAEPERFYRAQILPDKLARNLAYLSNISLRTDLRIILETVGSAFLGSKKDRDVPPVGITHTSSKSVSSV